MRTIPVAQIKALISYVRGDENLDEDQRFHLANYLDEWLREAQADPAVVLSEVMSKIAALPSCSQDFLGNDLYDRVQTALGQEIEHEDDEEPTDEN